MLTWAGASTAVLWLATVGMMIVKAPGTVTTFYRIQAIAEAGLGAVMAISGHLPILWVTVGLTVLIRVIAIPRIVNHGITSPNTHYSAKAPTGMGALLIYALFCTIGGLLVGELGLPRPVVAGLIFASMFVSFVHLSSRYEAWSMLWALLSLDTIVDAGVLIFAPTLPELTDLGLIGISLALAVVLAFVARQIQALKNSLDVRELEELIG